MAGAQFVLPLITVIPGQLITAALWQNEFTNINVNFNPPGMDGYSDTDAQMQIQTPPYPGSITSHATNLGGELERIRYQISQILGPTTPAYWYAAPPANLTTLGNVAVPIGGSMLFPSATPPNANWLLKNGQAIGRVAYSALFALIGTTFGAGDGTTTFNIPNAVDKMPIGAGNLYALAATGGAVANTPTITATDSGHNHTQNAHTHTTPNHLHNLAGLGTIIGGASGGAPAYIVGDGTRQLIGGSAGGLTLELLAAITETSGGGTSGSTTPTNNVGNAVIAASSSAVPTLPPYLAEYWMIRVL